MSFSTVVNGLALLWLVVSDLLCFAMPIALHMENGTTSITHLLALIFSLRLGPSIPQVNPPQQLQILV